MIRIGVCGNAGGRSSDRDVEMARIARAEVWKAMSHGDPAEIDKCRAFNPAMLFILRLYIGGLDNRFVPPYRAAADWEPELRSFYDKGVRHVEIHNEPNLRIEGWGTNWTDGKYFGVWWLEVRQALAPKFPGVLWGFPGVSPGFGFDGREESNKFLLEAGEAIAVSDWFGWHCYYVDDHGATHPDLPGTRARGKPVFITEYSNPTTASYPNKARQARLFAEALAGTDIQAACYFCTGGSSFPEQVMRKDDNSSTGIAEELGRRVMEAPPMPADVRQAKVISTVNVRKDDNPDTITEKIYPPTVVTLYGQPFTIPGREGLGKRVYIDPPAPRRHIWVNNVQELPTGLRLSWPVRGVPQRIGQEFGANPQNYIPFGLPAHEGRDIHAPEGTDVIAMADGTVKYVNLQSRDYQPGVPFTSTSGHPYGNHVWLEHRVSGEVYYTEYAHLRDIVVQAGQAVRAGDLLGHADDTGNSFGSHLHITVKMVGETARGYRDDQGRAWPHDIIDPRPFMEI